jgi:hypothetical protein
MRQPSSVLKVLGIFTLVAFGCGGCVDANIDRLARHDLSSPPSSTTLSVVREPGLYTVKWVKDKETSGPVAGTERLFTQGDRIGFETTECGELLAVAGQEVFAIPSPLPPGARRVVWYTKFEEPSDLTKGVGMVLQRTGEAALIGGAGAGLVGLAALEGAAKSYGSEEAEAERYSRRQRHHRHRRHDY